MYNESCLHPAALKLHVVCSVHYKWKPHEHTEDECVKGDHQRSMRLQGKTNQKTEIKTRRAEQKREQPGAAAVVWIQAQQTRKKNTFMFLTASTTKWGTFFPLKNFEVLFVDLKWGTSNHRLGCTDPLESTITVSTGFQTGFISHSLNGRSATYIRADFLSIRRGRGGLKTNPDCQTDQERDHRWSNSTKENPKLHIHSHQNHLDDK